MELRLYPAAGKDLRLLQVGDIEEGACWSRHVVPFYIPDDADDLPRTILVNGEAAIAEKNVLSDRVFVGEVPVREALVDDDTPWRIFGVVLIEVTSPDERDLQRAKETGTYFHRSCPESLVGWGHGVAQN